MYTTNLVVKVASRCNLNCTYCYVYNMGDNSYKLQPKFMSIETIKKINEFKLIAEANAVSSIYKNPDFIFFDEATSNLDTINENKIMHNLNDYLKSKTAIIIAHRLSTVKNADNIIVLKNGKIVEQGTHKELVEMKNEYFNLVKNQLELSV